MKAVLEINPGIRTKAIHIPDQCFKSGIFRVPYMPQISLHAVNVSQDFIAATSDSAKILEFQLDWRSVDGPKRLPVFKLVFIN